MSDPIDEAIAAAAAQSAIPMATLTGTLNATGRPFSISLSADASDLELLALCGQVIGLHDQIRQNRERHARGGLVIPGRVS